MALNLKSSGGGSVTLDVPSTAANYTATLPAGTGNVVVNGINGSIVSGTAITASGTSVDFTGIPSWVKRITVMFNGVSTTGSSQPYLQIGDSGGIESTGYSTTVGSISTVANNTDGSNSVTAAFPLYSGGTGGAATVMTGVVTLAQLTGNTWTASGNLLTSSRTVSLAGAKTLSDTLTQIRITTAGGTDTFDAGSINILYE